MSIDDFVEIIQALSVYAEKHLPYMRDSGYLNVEDVSDKYKASKGNIKRISFGVDVYNENDESKKNKIANDNEINSFLEFIKTKEIEEL